MHVPAQCFFPDVLLSYFAPFKSTRKAMLDELHCECSVTKRGTGKAAQRSSVHLIKKKNEQTLVSGYTTMNDFSTTLKSMETTCGHFLEHGSDICL